MVNNKTLRANARAQLGGGIFKNKWLMILLALLIYNAIISVGSSLTFGIVTLIVAGPLYYGVIRLLFTAMRSDEEIDLGNLFCGFKECFSQSLLLSLLMSIFVALWSLLFVIPGIIKMLSYSLAPYIQHDSEDKDWKVCLDKSKAMMKGHKWQLFCLHLSFIGWYLLGSLCFGIGTLFVIPYHEMAVANFYEALRAEGDAKLAE